jgi:hypothetical protein
VYHPRTQNMSSCFSMDKGITWNFNTEGTFTQGALRHVIDPSDENGLAGEIKTERVHVKSQQDVTLFFGPLIC